MTESILIDSTSTYHPIESWVYDRYIAPAVTARFGPYGDRPWPGSSWTSLVELLATPAKTGYDSESADRCSCPCRPVAHTRSRGPLVDL